MFCWFWIWVSFCVFV